LSPLLESQMILPSWHVSSGYLTTSMQSGQFLGSPTFISDSLLGFWCSSPWLPHLQGHPHPLHLGLDHTEVFEPLNVPLCRHPSGTFQPWESIIVETETYDYVMWQSYPRALPMMAISTQSCSNPCSISHQAQLKHLWQGALSHIQVLPTVVNYLEGCISINTPVANAD